MELNYPFMQYIESGPGTDEFHGQETQGEHHKGHQEPTQEPSHVQSMAGLDLQTKTRAVKQCPDRLERQQHIQVQTVERSELS